MLSTFDFLYSLSTCSCIFIAYFSVGGMLGISAQLTVTSGQNPYPYSEDKKSWLGIAMQSYG